MLIACRSHQPLATTSANVSIPPLPTPTQLPPTASLLRGAATAIDYLLANTQPGKATRSQVEATLDKTPFDPKSGLDPYGKEVTYYHYGLPLPDLLKNPDSDICLIRLAYSNEAGIEIVEQAHVYLSTVQDREVGGVIQAYGSPEIVQLTSCANPAPCVIILAYPSLGFELIVDGWPDGRAIRQKQIELVTLFVPMTLDEYRAQRFTEYSQEVLWSDLE